MEGNTEQLVVQATGVGKRSQAVYLASKFRNSLFLAHTEELVEQAYDDFCKFYGSENVGLVKDSRNDWDKKFVVSSPLTLVSRMGKMPEDHFDLTQIDEAHHYMSRVYYKAATYFKSRLRVGWTATPVRLDGLSLSDLFPVKVFEYNILDGIQDGYLSELKGLRIATKVDISKVKRSMGDFAVNELSELVDTNERNFKIVHTYQQYCENRQFIAFTVDVNHALHLHQYFEDAGIPTAVICANKEICPDREERIERFKNKELRGLININILTEGFDYSDVGAILDAAPTMSLARYMQRVGRGTRLKSDDFFARFGARNCLIVDFVDVSSKHNLVNSYTLDAKLPGKEKIFVTAEDREKIVNAEQERQNRKVMGEIQQDQYVDLLKLPTTTISKSERMMEYASDKQIGMLDKFGLYSKYDEFGNETIYTKRMVAEALESDVLPWMHKKLLSWGYNPNHATISQFLTVSREVNDRIKQEQVKRQVQESLERYQRS